MTINYKTDHRGRITNKPFGSRIKRALGLPKGVGFCIPVPGHVLLSAAWMGLPLSARRVLDAIMSDHAQHGGQMNGELLAPYTQLQARGVRRSSIKEALVILEAVGLIKADRDTRSGAVKRATMYRLTWLGTPDGLTATNDWKAIKTEEEADARINNALDELNKNRVAQRKRRATRGQSETISTAA